MSKFKMSWEQAKKFKAMNNNMVNFLNSKNLNPELIQLGKVFKPDSNTDKESDKENKEIPSITYNIIKGSCKNNQDKVVNYLIKINQTLKKDNGYPQVELLISINDKYITTYPQTNPHLEFILLNFDPVLITYKIPDKS